MTERNRQRRYTGLQRAYRTGLTSSSIALNDTERVINTISVDVNNNQLIMCNIHRITWLDTRHGDNWLPHGINFDYSNFNIFNLPHSYRYLADEVLNVIEDNQDQDQLFIENLSGLTQTFLFDADVRYILSQGGRGDYA